MGPHAFIWLGMRGIALLSKLWVFVIVFIMHKLQRKWLVCAALCAAAVVADLVQRAVSAIALPVAQPVAASPGTFAQPARLPLFTLLTSGKIPMPPDTPAAHASSLLAMPAGSQAQMLAFWFAGARESAPNVQIAFSWFDRSGQAWVPARFVLNRNALGQQLGYGVRRLGNPVAWLDASGRVHLFVVATGLGGWAAGRIVHLRQDSDAVATTAESLARLEFSPVRMLPLSWLWNTSHLVRTAPMPLADGGMVLPVYFELGLKYPVALRFDAQGQWLGMVRMSMRGDSLQPSIVPLSGTQWIAYLRDHSAVGKVAVVATDDAWQTWRDMPPLDVVNTGSSVAAMRLPNGGYVMAHNKSPVTRHDMDMSTSADGLHWQSAVSVASGAKLSDEYSYPALAWDGQSLWLSYTDMRREIAWRRYSVQPEAKAP
jgi:predicted neuraminidase